MVWDGIIPRSLVVVVVFFLFFFDVTLNAVGYKNTIVATEAVNVYYDIKIM